MLFLVSMVVYVVSFLLMQALSRYREFAADRGAAIITGRPSALACALMKISSGMEQIPQKDLRTRGRARGLLHLPRRRRQGDRRPVRHAPADGEAHRAPCSASRRSSRAAAWTPSLRRMGFLDVLRGKREARRAGAADRLFAMTTAYVDARDGARAEDHRQGRRSSSSRSRPPTSRASSRHGGGRARAPARRRAPPSRSRDDEFGYRWMILVDPDFEDLVVGINAVSTALAGRRLRRPRPGRRVRVPDEAGKRRLLDLQLQARRVLPVRAGRRRAAARQRARAAPEGPDRRGAAGRGRARALVPPLGRPAAEPGSG